MKNLTWDNKRLVIESIIAIVCAFIGVIFGKVSNTYYYNGQKITETELNAIMAENAEFKTLYDTVMKENEALTGEIESLSKDNDNYKKLNNELTNNNKELEKQINIVPLLEFKDIGLMINGEEKIINKINSNVIIDGKQYFSKDFIDSVIGQNEFMTIKDDTMYIGKIIKDKAKLFDMPMVDESTYASIKKNIKDTYGNIHEKAVFLEYWDNDITFNAGKEYSKLKCTIAIAQGYDGGGIIQIETEQGIVYISEKITSITEPYEIDIPINQASRITIKYLDQSANGGMVADAILYNEE